MCDGQKHTIDTFFSSPMQKDEQRFMLFDSDMPSPDKQAICAASNKSFKKRLISATPENTFLMIQEAEPSTNPAKNSPNFIKRAERLTQKSTNLQRFSRNSTPQN